MSWSSLKVKISVWCQENEKTSHQRLGENTCKKYFWYINVIQNIKGTLKRHQ